MNLVITMGIRNKTRVVFKKSIDITTNLDSKLEDKLIQYIDQTLIKEYNKWNHDHVRAIKDYTESSLDLNNVLLRNKKIKHEPEYKRTIKNLDSALSQHVLSEDIQVFSGLNFTPENYAFHPNEKYIKVFVPCYMSTTISHDIATGFGNVDTETTKRSRHVYVVANYRKNYNTYKFKYKKLSYNEWRKLYLLSKDADNWALFDKAKRELTEKYTKKWNIKRDVIYGNQTLVEVNWFKHILRIEVPRGSRGGYINHHSSHKENEFLIPRNSIIHVDPKPIVDVEELTVTWHGRLAYDGTKPTTYCNWGALQKYAKRKLKR